MVRVRQSDWRRRAVVASCILAALLYGGCAKPRPASPAALAARAAFDLSCGQQRIQIYPLDPRTRGVAGCGRRLTYVEVCDDFRGRASCRWRLESPPWLPVPVAAPPASLAPPASAPRSPDPAAAPSLSESEPASSEAPPAADAYEDFAPTPPASTLPPAPPSPSREFGF